MPLPTNCFGQSGVNSRQPSLAFSRTGGYRNSTRDLATCVIVPSNDTRQRQVFEQTKW